MLSDLPTPLDPRVLVDFRTADDAGVYKLGEDLALVQTVDFFTPIVDDPFVYGQIAAANALSDVYAMGGTPLTALAIAAFPKSGLDQDIIRKIFAGGVDKLREAGVALMGGHTVQDTEVKFGYAVTGTIDPARVLSNAGARAGDLLLLTKPLGTGIVATALKFGRVKGPIVERATRGMTMLNKTASSVLTKHEGAVHACTDVTGFGLIGHATEVGAASHVTIVIRSEEVPLLDGVLELARKNQTGGGSANEDHFGSTTSFQAPLAPELRIVLFDPQTSGGLLIAVAPQEAEAMLAHLRTEGVDAVAIGHVQERGAHTIVIN